MTRHWMTLSGIINADTSIDAATAKRLSTRFVHTWREKVVDGARVWLRRARYVAKEFACPTPDRQICSARLRAM